MTKRKEWEMTLREAISDWATRNEPWTGASTMTAEDGYHAAIEEVANILNTTWQADNDQRVAWEQAAVSKFRQLTGSAPEPEGERSLL